MRWLVGALALVAAVGSGAAAADGDDFPPEAWTLTAPVAMPSATPTSGACIPDLLGMTWLDEVAAAKRTVTLCRQSDDVIACWSLDVDRAVLATARVTPAIRAHFRGKAPAPKKTVAHGRAFKVTPFDGSARTPESVALRVLDRKSGKLLWKKTFGELESECPLASWAGDNLYAELGVCAGPGAVGVFFDGATGMRLGVLGGQKESASAWDVKPVALPSGVVAFREQYGRALFFHDPKSAALIGQMNLSGGLARRDGELVTSAEEGWMVSLPRADGKLDLVVGHGDASRDRVMVIDPEGRVVTRLITLAACAP